MMGARQSSLASPVCPAGVPSTAESCRPPRFLDYRQKDKKCTLFLVKKTKMRHFYVNKKFFWRRRPYGQLL